MQADIRGRGVRTTAQFSSKIFSKEAGQPHLWTSDNLNHYSFSKDKQNFKAEGCSMELSEDGKSYHIKSNTSKQATVDVKFTRLAPGFVAGKDGTSSFGTDPTHPWGRMYHKFWPRCEVEGTIVTKEGPVDLKGKGIFIHALQGMKPHFAGKPLAYLSKEIRLTARSCQVELCLAAVAHIHCGHDGVHDTALIR